LKLLIVLLLSPLVAHAGVVYDVAFRHVDQSNLGGPSAGSPPDGAVVTRYFVNDGQVRAGGPSAKTVYVFNGTTLTVIDSPARTAHVLEHSTLSQIAAHYADAVKMLENAAAAAAPESRAQAEQKATDMRAASDRLLQRVPREFRVTTRFESVDGRACRVWEEREQGAKRMELCVAPVGAVQGGAQILSGMKTLSRFRQGADFAFGVELGLSDWWSDFAMLGGIPLLVREYKYDSVVAETLLTGMREEPVSASLYAVPDGYALVNGPDYTVWYVR
jgi:hypothetical protein